MKTRKGIILLLFLLGIPFSAVGILMGKQAYSQASYIPATGKSLGSDIRMKNSTSVGSGQRSSTWRLFVEYEYWIGGEYFTSNRIASSPPGSNSSFGKPPSEELRALEKRYEAGNRITVYVSPDRPERSVLMLATYKGLWFALVGGLMVLAGFCVCFFVPRSA